MFDTDVHAIGLEAAQGTYMTTASYWNMDDKTRAWSKKFFAKTNVMPTMIHTGVYGSVLHYLKAIKAAGTDDPQKVMAKMRELPIEDVFVHGGRLREDGRVIRDMYLAQGEEAVGIQGAVGLSRDRQDGEGRGCLPAGLRIQVPAAQEVRTRWQCGTTTHMNAMRWWSAPVAPACRPRSPPVIAASRSWSSRRSRASAAPPRAPAAGYGFPAPRWRKPGASRKRRSRRGPICATRPATAFDAARVDAFLTNGPEAVDFFTDQDGAAFRHAADLPRLSRRGARRRARRPLDGDAAVRRPRTRRPHQGSRRSAARTHRVRHDARLRQGDHPFHARDEIADVGDLCGQATVETFHGCAAATAAA